MDRRRNVSMDFSVSIPAAAAAAAAAASMQMMDKENTSDDKISIIIPQRSSPSSKILPLGFQQDEDDEASDSPPPSLAKRTTTLVPLIKKVVAELLGTFLLVFTAVSALIMNEVHGGALGLVGEAAVGGLAVVVVVAAIVHVSGGHINPAVSVAMAVFGHLPPAHLAPYAAAQLLGATAASFVVKALYDPANFGPTVTTVPRIGAFEAFWVEFVATFVLLFVVTALATDPRAVKELVAVGAGAAVMMNALVCSESTGGSMNPARSLGTAIATGTYTKIWIYMVAPPLGAIAGSGAYHAIK